ncbi:hypothetical protein [Paraferrimonas haliotis]|uniref:hypothetical protein n=1 Tax=Paraferrimonas haliotis TaxID=2013866 RepID=UPI000BA8FCDF|nr:hypothetical protein [Paraferrimonas haliotis]
MAQFKIHKNGWFAWQMIPGYIGERSIPYCSPIYITDFKPLKTGKNLMRIDFINVFYAEGAQNFSLDIRVLKRAKNYLVAELYYGSVEPSERTAIISHIEFGWVERFCPKLWYNRPPSSTNAGTSSIGLYLTEVFGISRP